ncbi:MAG: MBL fold metallo-hydrolase [Myxococcales bacterium]|nr:MBL fold metallo-hydrolase [Myxococcales bacterium]
MPLTISRILHAGYVFNCDGVSIAFDPIFESPFSTNCHSFPAVRFDRGLISQLHFDAVFISHFHDDHCSFDSLTLLPRATPIRLFCVFPELAEWISALGFVDVRPLVLGVPVTVGPFEVIPTRALDADVDSIFQIKAAGLNVLNVVDSWIDDDTLDDLAEYAPWDLVLWPFQTMRELEVIAPSRAAPAPGTLPPEWLDQLRALRPRGVVPSSCQFEMEPWSWYNHAFFPITYEQFAREVTAALDGVQIVRLDPSRSVRFDGATLAEAPSLPWVAPIGEQDVDYDYRPDLPPPSTAEIARHFGALTDPQRERVLHFCRSDLLDQYEALDTPESPYFRKARRWRLTLCDGDDSIHFEYIVHRGHIYRNDEHRGTLAWTTEIPMARLLGALESGEQLTSLYIRINDAVFEPEIEEALAEVDVVADPLIRTLYDGVFGAYQSAQLQRLLRRLGP